MEKGGKKKSHIVCSNGVGLSNSASASEIAQRRVATAFDAEKTAYMDMKVEVERNCVTTHNKLHSNRNKGLQTAKIMGWTRVPGDACDVMGSRNLSLPVLNNAASLVVEDEDCKDDMAKSPSLDALFIKSDNTSLVDFYATNTANDDTEDGHRQRCVDDDDGCYISEGEFPELDSALGDDFLKLFAPRRRYGTV